MQALPTLTANGGALLRPLLACRHPPTDRCTARFAHAAGASPPPPPPFWTSLLTASLLCTVSAAHFPPSPAPMTCCQFQLCCLPLCSPAAARVSPAPRPVLSSLAAHFTSQLVYTTAVQTIEYSTIQELSWLLFYSAAPRSCRRLAAAAAGSAGSAFCCSHWRMRSWFSLLLLPEAVPAWKDRYSPKLRR